MPKIEFTISTAALKEIEDAFAERYNYQATFVNPGEGVVPNLESKAQFTKRKIGEYVKSVVKGSKVRTATEAAKKVEQAKEDIIIT